MIIAAFNVRRLGLAKVNRPDVLKNLIKIMSRYSVVVILEVVDKNRRAINKLLRELNKNNSDRNSYSMISSRQLGRDSYKERFVCFYREREVWLKAFHQYEDNQLGDEDAFAREPLLLHFSCPSTEVGDLVLIPVHTKPKDTPKELDELYDVVEAVIQNWGTDKIMILGDFNADGSYLSNAMKKKLRISSTSYYWLIGDGTDTTSSNFNDYAYDRIVVYGETMLDAVVPGSAKAFNFQEAFDLTDEDTQRISDHYPVEVKLRTKWRTQRQRQATARRPTPRNGPQRKNVKKAEPAPPQKKNIGGKRKSGASSNTQAKRRRFT